MWQEFERWEVLVRDEARVGVLYRALESNVLLTRVLVEDDGEPYRAESRLRLEPGNGSWELSWYRDRNLGVAKLMRREPQGLPSSSMPSYGDILMLFKAIEDPGKQVHYWRLNEADWDVQDANGHLGAEPNAHIQRVGALEQLPIPLGAAVSTRRYEAWADGVLVATHWVDEGNELVCTLWGGDLHSYRVPGTASEAGWMSLSGLDDGTVEFMTGGFDAGS